MLLNIWKALLLTIGERRGALLWNIWGTLLLSIMLGPLLLNIMGSVIDEFLGKGSDVIEYLGRWNVIVEHLESVLVEYRGKEGYRCF